MLPIERKTPAGAAGAAAQDNGAAGVRARLRAARERLAQGSTRLFVLPGYDTDNPELAGGQLVARYRRLTFEDLQKAFQGIREGSDVVAANAQFLVDACEEILYRDPDGQLHELVEGAATTYTINLQTHQSLATVLGVEHEPTARDQLVAAFGGNELAVNEHSGLVHAWMTSANHADAETALGESPARRT